MQSLNEVRSMSDLHEHEPLGPVEIEILLEQEQERCKRLQVRLNEIAEIADDNVDLDAHAWNAVSQLASRRRF